MEIEEQKEQMNQMLDYLGKTSYSLQWGNQSNYIQTHLTYTKEDSLLWKETTKYNFMGKVTEHVKKEKAMGGSNGDDIYNAIKKATLAKAEKIVIRRLINRELEDNNVFL